MPYPRAWIWVTVLLVLTVPAFSRNYLGQLGAVEWQIHVHGITAGLWVLLVISQSWTIHHGHRSLHRTAGLTSLILAPLFLAGGILVLGTMALRPGPFTEMFGARLALFDVVSIFGFAGFVFMALKHRSNVGLHAGWMLATVIPLITPTISRIIPAFVPGLTIRSIEEFPRFAGSIHLGQAIAMGIALFLFLRNRQHGTPMLVVIGILALQSLLFETVAQSAWWSNAHAQIGATSPLVLAAVGVVMGAVAVLAGWKQGASKHAALN